MRRKTGSEREAGITKVKVLSAAADRKLLQVGGEAKRRPKRCCTVEPCMCEQHGVSDLVKMEKTLPFTLAESWDKETWGLHTVY